MLRVSKKQQQQQQQKKKQKQKTTLKRHNPDVSSFDQFHPCKFLGFAYDIQSYEMFYLISFLK